MAKANDNNTGITFGTWEEPEKANPYVDTIKAMIEKGEDCAVTLVVAKGDAGKTRTLFAKAANDAGKTARVRVNEAEGDNNWKFVFTLTQKHKARRGQKQENAD